MQVNKRFHNVLNFGELSVCLMIQLIFNSSFTGVSLANIFFLFSLLLSGTVNYHIIKKHFGVKF